jgi:hypothetical protein
MLTNLDPASALAIALLIFCFVMVVLFEATGTSARGGWRFPIRALIVSSAP